MIWDWVRNSIFDSAFDCPTIWDTSHPKLIIGYLSATDTDVVTIGCPGGACYVSFIDGIAAINKGNGWQIKNWELWKRAERIAKKYPFVSYMNQYTKEYLK